MAKISSSPTENRAMKPNKPFRQKAEKQKIAPRNVAAERSCKRSGVMSQKLDMRYKFNI